MENLVHLKELIDWSEKGKLTALTTVVWKRGSALRTVGAKMAISSSMEMSGSISGGCVEGAVVQEALKVMDSGIPVLLEYGIADETAWSVGLACGGCIKVWIQKVCADSTEHLSILHIKEMVRLFEQGIPFSTVSCVNGPHMGEVIILSPNEKLFSGDYPKWLSKQIIQEIRDLEKTETSQLLNTEDADLFVDVFPRQPRLVIIGAVHIAQPLAQMAVITGFSTVIIDPRKAFNTADRFPHVRQRVKKWPDEGLQEIDFCSDDYLMLLSHDDKLDLPALKKGIDKNLRYIGMLSSRQAKEKRFQLMEAEGYPRSKLDQIHSPVGLDIGARSQEEIALSILAEITAVRYGKSV